MSKAESVDTETNTVRSGLWRAGLALALVAVSTGVLLENTGVFLAAIVGLVYSGYTSLATPPDPTLYVERTVTPVSPDPGETVLVTVEVENVGSGPVADLRVADRPPAGLDVVDGDTRLGATLGPDESVTVRYDVQARRGKHRFGDVVCVSQSASGGARCRTSHAVEDEITCFTPFDTMDLTHQTGPGAGRVETDSGGTGVEFFATRQHHPTDSMRRIDWNRYAATGELTTVTYRESRAATVVCIVDGRHRVRRRAGEPNAVELCGYATVRVADALLDDQNRVGTVVFDDEGRIYRKLAVDEALDPARGPAQPIRIRSLLRRELGVEVDDVADRSPAERSPSAGERWEETNAGNGGRDARSAQQSAPDGGAESDERRPAPDGGTRTDWLRDHVPANAQVVFVSPLLDSVATDIVARLEAHGHALTVVSPDVTTHATPGGSIERIERALRLRQLRGDERVRVVDWTVEESLQAAVERDAAGWDL